MPSKKNILASACVILFKLFVAGWGVEWIRITISTGEIFSCPLKKKKRWLKNGEGNSQTVICTRSGNYKTVEIFMILSSRSEMILSLSWIFQRAP